MDETASGTRQDDDLFAGIDLTDDYYRVEQNLVRNKYTVYDRHDQPVLKGKQELFKLREAFPFIRPDGDWDDPVFTVRAKQILDIAGDYEVVDAGTGEVVLVLEKKFTFFHHKWAVRSPQGDVLARAESTSALLDLLRSISSFFALIPYTYEIKTEDGRKVGEIKEHFSIRDKFDVRIHDSGDVPKESLVVAAILIDALEGT